MTYIEGIKCEHYQKNKNFKSTRGLIRGNLEGDLPWKNLSIDTVGPIRYFQDQGKQRIIKLWIFTIQDRYSRFAKLYPLQETRTSDVIGKIQESMKTYSKTTSILFDHGVQFISDLYNEFCAKNKIKTLYMPRLTSQENGQCERINSTILNCFRIYREFDIEDIIGFRERN